MDPRPPHAGSIDIRVVPPLAILFARCLQLRAMPWLMNLAYGEFELPNERRGRKIFLDGTTPPNRYRKILRASLILR